MKTLGYLLITASFLAGSLVAVQTAEDEVRWSLFVPALGLGVLGVALAQWGARQASRHEDSLTTNIGALHRSIESLVEKINRLDDEKTDLHPFELHKRIDELFPVDLNAFVAARESIGHVYGLPAYAEVMNEFAAGERYLNRVWSASVDCYIDDCHEYLARAREQFQRARVALEALRDSA